MIKNLKQFLCCYLLLFSTFNLYSQYDELGGVATEGTLRVRLYNSTSINDIEVARYTSGSWVDQWFSSDSKSFKLYVGARGASTNQNYTGSIGYFRGGSPGWSTVSGNKIDNT